VRARYEIYVEGDRLWIIGSRHLLDVASDELDKQLEKRGWETTVAYGNFNICAAHLNDPKQLAITHNVTLKSYTDLQFRRR
jgi:hypothetical protein